jgi:uncharacterized membrane protein
MSKNQQSMNRFPNDRINNFSDAIFAIAITLLILEVKTPPSTDIQALGLLGALDKLFPSFVSLLVSFFVTALYWRAHLTNARYISFYDNKLLWLNIWLLLFVVALPFSTSLYSKNFGSTSSFIFLCDESRSHGSIQLLDGKLYHKKGRTFRCAHTRDGLLAEIPRNSRADDMAFVSAARNGYATDRPVFIRQHLPGADDWRSQV